MCFVITILLVEDNSGFRELFKEFLKESSLQVKLIEAINPIEGLQILEKQKYNFDFIICDYFLPIQNGNDFLEIVKGHNRSIKCILISAEEISHSKHLPNVDKFFTKSDIDSLITYLEFNMLSVF